MKLSGENHLKSNILMPQLDQFTYFTQFFWLCLFFFTFYILICNDRYGVLGISRILKLRNKLLSHRGNNIQRKDPKSLEDILRKGFHTGVSYMYSSLFEVSQWCNILLSNPLLIRALLVAALLLVLFILAKIGGGVSILNNFFVRSSLSLVVDILLKSTGLRGVSLLLVGAILRCCFSPTSMIEPSGSDLPDLNAPAPEPEATAEEIGRVRQRLFRYMLLVGPPNIAPDPCLSNSLEKTFHLGEKVSERRLQALDSILEEETHRVLGGESTDHIGGLLRLKKKMDRWDLENGSYPPIP